MNNRGADLFLSLLLLLSLPPAVRRAGGGFVAIAISRAVFFAASRMCPARELPRFLLEAEDEDDGAGNEPTGGGGWLD